MIEQQLYVIIVLLVFFLAMVGAGFWRLATELHTQGTRLIAALKEETAPQWTPIPEGVAHPRGVPDCPHKDRPIYAVHHTGATGCFECATKKETP